MADMGGMKAISPTPGSTVTITIDSTSHLQIASWTAGQAETVNVSGTPVDGQFLILIITNDGILGRVITLGTGLAGLGIITGIASKKATVFFIASGGSFIELSRSVGI